jgi:hypothetical protein
MPPVIKYRITTSNKAQEKGFLWDGNFLIKRKSLNIQGILAMMIVIRMSIDCVI